MHTDHDSVNIIPPVKNEKRKESTGFFRSFIISRMKMPVILAAAVMLTGCSGTTGAGNGPDTTAAAGIGTDTGSTQKTRTDTAQKSTGSAENNADVSDEIITFTDDLGREIAVKRPERVIAMIGSFADIWHLAGGADTMVAAAHDAWTSFNLNLDDSVADIGAVKEPSLETILAAQPDFILGSVKTTSNVELMETFEQAGIPIAYFDVNGFDDYLRMLKVCTDLTGQTEYYETNGLNVEKQIEEVLARKNGEAPTVLTIRATGSSCKVRNSTGTVMGEMLYDLGCINIADSNETLLENLSLEAIIAADPDYIFVVLQGSDSTDAQRTMEKTLLANPAWGHLRAVKEGNFHVMEHRLYNLKPNAQWGYAYEKLADILYPEAE